MIEIKKENGPQVLIFDKKEFDSFKKIVETKKVREDYRNEQIKLSGYEVFHVNELDYKNNKQEVVNTCLKFFGN